ncbi:MAG: RNA polymerase sigma factor [Anaerolineales bacterium]|nr:RNA polymerase sigma factor [Anaerolineales bacterium]
MDETALITAAKQGDLDSFNRLVLVYQDMVYGHACRMMGDAHEADDATQEAFISAFRHIHQYRGGSFRGWLLRIVTNACYDELRRKKRRSTLPLEPVTDDDESNDEMPWMVDQGERPEDAVQRKELGNAIQHCLDKLSPDFRVVVILVDIQGLDYQEASFTINKPIGTIKSRLARARLSMRNCLQSFRELLPSSFRLIEEGTK